LFASSVVTLCLKVNLKYKAAGGFMSVHSKLIILVTLLIVGSSLAHAKKNIQNKGQEHQRPSFESIDINTDGDIDFDEFSSHELPHGDHQSIFTSIDTDNNGVISQEEFDNHIPPHPKDGRGNRHD